MYDYFDDKYISEKDLTKSKYKIVIGLVFAIVLAIGVFFFGIYQIWKGVDSLFSSSDTLIEESISSDNKYKIEAYLHSAGATVDFSVTCKLFIDGKEYKTIYTDYHMKDAIIEWIDNDTVSINSHVIELPHGEYDWTKDLNRNDNK